MNFAKCSKDSFKFKPYPKGPGKYQDLCTLLPDRQKRRQYLFPRRLQSKALNLQVIPIRPSHGDPPGLRRARIHAERTYGFPPPSPNYSKKSHWKLMGTHGGTEITQLRVQDQTGHLQSQAAHPTTKEKPYGQSYCI